MDKAVYNIVYQNLTIPRRTSHNIICILFSLRKSFRCRKIYQRAGLNEAIHYVENLSRKKSAKPSPNLDFILYQTRKVMVIHNLFCRFYKKSFNCLETSLSLIACLVNLGYHVTLKIGKSTNYVNQFFDFHAWVSIEGKPINDTNHVLEMYVPVFEKTF